MEKAYAVHYVSPSWARHPTSPFAGATIWHATLPDAEREAAWLNKIGMVQITIEKRI